jgi:D-alanyl-D-alanine dipeptidase
MIISVSSCFYICSQNKNYARDTNIKPDDFVYVSDYVNDAILDIRYYSKYNFVGEKIDGYLAPRPMMTKQAAIALASAAEELRAQGYRIIVYDTYRPKKAVKHFIRWVEDNKSIGLKDDFFPKYDKKMLFKLGFISKKSGHSRGSTIDLGLVTKDSKLIDMGGSFDYFDDISNSDFKNISMEQIKNRKILKDAMLKAGFRGIKSEWWHFTLNKEPYPYTYFDFDVK